MSERPSNGFYPPEEEKEDNNYTRARIKSAALAGSVASAVGGLSYLGAHFAGLEAETAAKIGLRVGGFVATVGTADRFSSVSLNEALDLATEGKNLKFRLKFAQSASESAFAVGVGFGLLASLSERVDITALATVVGLGTGVELAHDEYRNRTHNFPDLVLPQGNSMLKDNSFPERYQDLALPPVFRANSISDLVEWRELNKEKIVRRTKTIPPLSDAPEWHRPPLMATIIAVLPEVQHVPILDTEFEEGSVASAEINNPPIKLFDQTQTITANPTRRSKFFWTQKTAFDNPHSGLLDMNKWYYWKNLSWKSEAVILAQYQISRVKKLRRKIKVDDVVDKYWLIDIGKRRGENQETIFVPSPTNTQI